MRHWHGGWKDTLTYCFIGFNFITAFIILNWTVCFSIYRRSQCLKPRQPIIPILIGIASVIFCCVDRSQVLLHACLTTPIQYNGWIIVSSICFQIFVLTMFLIAYRGWNIYYDIKFNKALQDKQWRLYINPAENNWFLKHRKTYGNKNKMILFFIIPWLITASIYLLFITSSNAFNTLSRSTLIFQTVLVMTFLIYIWYRIPKFDDTWRMRHELILTVRLFVLGLSIFIVLGMILDWKPPNWKYAILSSLGTMAALLECYAVLFYPLKKFNLPICMCQIKTRAARQRADVRRFKKKQKLDGNDIDLTLHSDSENENKRQQMGTQFFKLKAILYHKDGFRLFASHLMKEFAIENLLFFVETSQWMEAIIHKCEQEHIPLSVDAKASGIDVKFHKNVPKSRVVTWSHDDDRTIERPREDLDVDTTVSGVGLSSATLGTLSTANTASRSGNGHHKSLHATQLTIDLNLDDFELTAAITDPWFQCVKLFYKYVVNGSYFCINISGEDRIELFDKLGYDAATTKCDEELVVILKEKCNNEIDKLFHIFDTARYSVFRLMIYSVSRFETSDAYLEHFIPTEV